MEPSARQSFNQNFTGEKYQRFLSQLNEASSSNIEFRVAETPVFLTDDFRDKLIEAGEDIIKTILRPDFKELTERAIPDQWRVANENDHPHFIALDFGVCKDEHGNIVPKLIELQGFPSLFGFQVHVSNTYHSAFEIPGYWDMYFSGLDQESYLDLLKRTVVGPHHPDEV